MDEIQKFKEETKANIQKQESLIELGKKFIYDIKDYKYQHNFTWLGVPIIQYPQDIMAVQEIIFNVKPDLIIETGIARGGSLIFSASMLTLLETCGEHKNSKVIGIDIDIRKHNKELILKHPLSKKIIMLEGSSTDQKIIQEVYDIAKNYTKILVLLDSNHTHKHVLDELNAYSKLVSINSYCIVFDTGIEDFPKGSFNDRPWDKDNNPKTAVWEFLKNNNKFLVDKNIENQILITATYNGFLKRIKA